MIFERRTRMPVSAAELYAWHARDGAFERLLPPWDSTRVVSRSGPLADGCRVVLSIPAGPFRATWVADHDHVTPGRTFRDVQTSGPFSRFEHTHRMEPVGPNESDLVDHVEFDLPFGAIGRVIAARGVTRRLDRMFRHRHGVTHDDLSRHASPSGALPMRILVTGASGLVGSALVPFLQTGGHTVARAVRSLSADPATRTCEVTWSPATGTIDVTALGSVDAIVHLAGETVAQRWNASSRKAIMDSRVEGTRLIAEVAARMNPKPRVLVCASAVGWYGDTGETEVREGAPRGAGFLADVVEAWERAAEPARAAGIRVVHLRFGVVLSPRGGALAKMLTPFKLCAGGVIGSGRQAFPWISVDDAVAVVDHALRTESLGGPVNAVAPEFADNRSFTKTLGRVLGRPTIFPMPAFVARLAFGEMANEMLLTGPRVAPAALSGSRFQWRHPTLEAALRGVLGA